MARYDRKHALPLGVEMWSQAVMTCTICTTRRFQGPKLMRITCCCAAPVTRSCIVPSTTHPPWLTPYFTSGHKDPGCVTAAT